MAKKLTKALRGKRRWIGCEISGFSGRTELEQYLSNYPVKLYDFEDDKCILMVRLDDYDSIKRNFIDGKIKTVTSSGKIRLVRERMGFFRKPRKR
jgi:hypothetical protein